MPDPLSAVVITLNEEKNIRRCLESLRGTADEIVVVDSGSTDKTPEICREFSARFFTSEWMGYAATKNYANSLASHNWILSIDADEALSPELATALQAEKKRGFTEACRFARLTNYCGQWVRHGGWYPDYKVRLFDRRQTAWTGDIHETLTGTDPLTARLLTGNCLHYSYYDVQGHINQAFRFAGIAAQSLHKNGRSAGLWRLFISPLAKFIGIYFARLGFLDGKAGLRIAWISARAVHHKYSTLRKLNKHGEKS